MRVAWGCRCWGFRIGRGFGLGMSVGNGREVCEYRQGSPDRVRGCAHRQLLLYKTLRGSSPVIDPWKPPSMKHALVLAVLIHHVESRRVMPVGRCQYPAVLWNFPLILHCAQPSQMGCS